MANTKDLQIIISAKDQASKELQKIKKSFKDVQDQAKKVGVAAGAMAAVGVAAIKDFVDAANVQLRVEKQLEAVIESTGGAAGMTADEVKKMAAELQKVTTIGDEVGLVGSNMLLTFTKIGKETIPKATETLYDMATAMNGGATPSAEMLKAQAIQLGKALNDPIMGVSALARVGVQLTDQQKEMIVTLAEAGDVVGAQGVILDELSNQFGGSARAAAETFEGKMIQLNNRFGDLKEQIGMAMIPVLERLAGVFEQVVGWFEALSPEQKEFIAQAALAGTAILGVVAALAGIIAIANPITLTVAAIGAVMFLLKDQIIEAWGVISSFMIDSVEKIKAFMKPILDEIASFWGENAQDIQNVLSGLFSAFALGLNKMLEVWGVFWQALEPLFTAVWEIFVANFQVYWEIFKTYFSVALKLLQGDWQGAWDKMKQGGEQVFKAVVELAKAFWEALRIILQPIIDIFSFGFSKALETTQNAFETAFNAIKLVVDTIGGAIISVIDNIIGRIESMIKTVQQAAGAVGGFSNNVSGSVQGSFSRLGARLTGQPVDRRAIGGPVQQGRSYLVGERGPEMFTPTSGGSIISNKNMSGGGGGASVVLSNNVFLSEDVAEQIGDMLLSKLKLNNRI